MQNSLLAEITYDIAKIFFFFSDIPGIAKYSKNDSDVRILRLK